MPSLPFNIQFGDRGDYKLWAREGWYHESKDKEHTWAGHVAKLLFMLDYSRVDLLLQIDVVPFVAKGVSQELFVFLNGAFVAFWSVREPSQKAALVEASHVNSRENLFTFVSPKAICPMEQGINNDERTLGLAFRSLSLSLVQQ